jgi:hypothetical protein
VPLEHILTQALAFVFQVQLETILDLRQLATRCAPQVLRVLEALLPHAPRASSLLREISTVQPAPQVSFLSQVLRSVQSALKGHILQEMQAPVQPLLVDTMLDLVYLLKPHVPQAIHVYLVSKTKSALQGHILPRAPLLPILSAHIVP